MSAIYFRRHYIGIRLENLFQNNYKRIYSLSGNHTLALVFKIRRPSCQRIHATYYRLYRCIYREYFNEFLRKTLSRI